MDAPTTQAAAAGGAPAQFTITRQDHQSTFDPNNPNASTWTIYFTTPSGVQSYVTVPDADYTAEKVAQLITARVQQIEAVQGLGGGTGA